MQETPIYYNAAGFPCYLDNDGNEVCEAAGTSKARKLFIEARPYIYSAITTIAVALIVARLLKNR